MSVQSVRQIIKTNKYYIDKDYNPRTKSIFTAYTVGNEWKEEMLPPDSDNIHHQYSDYAGEVIDYAHSCYNCRESEQEIDIFQFNELVNNVNNNSNILRDNYKVYLELKIANPDMTKKELIKKAKFVSINNLTLKELEGITIHVEEGE